VVVLSSLLAVAAGTQSHPGGGRGKIWPARGSRLSTEAIMRRFLVLAYLCLAAPGPALAEPPNVVVILADDHGYHIGEHSQWAKTSCFEFDARVPFIVAPPGTKTAGKATQSLADLIDLFPTLTALCGLKTPAGLEGASLVPVLNDLGKAGKAAAFTQHPRPAYFDRTDKGVPGAMGYSVRTPTGRYTEWRDWATGKLIGAEWYDHRRDSQELTNRIDDARDSDDLRAARKALAAQFPPDVPSAKR
jgi:iduronate 2-sulfatase